MIDDFNKFFFFIEPYSFIILIINYYVLLIIIAYPFPNFEFMQFNFSSLQHVQLSSIEPYFPTPSVSLISDCVSSRAVVFRFQLFEVALLSWMQKSGDPPSA